MGLKIIINQSVRKSWRLLLIVLSIIIYSSVILLTPYIQKLLENGSNQNNQVAVQEGFQYDAYLRPGIYTAMSIEPPLFKLGSTSVITLESFAYTLEVPNNDKGPYPQKLCIDNINLIYGFQEVGVGVSKIGEETSYPLCFNLINANLIRKSQDKSVYTFFFERQVNVSPLSANLYGSQKNQFYYPFDTYQFEFGLESHYRLLNSSSLLKESDDAPIIDIDSNKLSGWNVSQRVIPIGESNIPNFYATYLTDINSVSLERPFFTRIVSVSILAIICLFTILLSINKSIDTFIEGGVGVFFGIFTLKQILLPESSEILLLIDLIIFGIVLIFGVALLTHLIPAIGSIFDRNRTYSEMEVAPKPKVIRKMNKKNSTKRKYDKP